MIIQIILIIIGFILLIKGADFLVEGASKIAKRFHIPEIVIGLTIVSIGTSMPELMVSITSAIEGYSDMAVGNVVGSNICNLLLILGLSTVIKSVVFKKETRMIEIPFCLAVSILLYFVGNSNQTITRTEGIILIIVFVCFLLYTLWMARKGEDFDREGGEIQDLTNYKGEISTIRNVIYLIIGIIALKFGGDLVVNNAEKIAQSLHISQKIISLTIIAIGTSLPELVTSVTAAIKGDSDIAIGNIIGSNIFNILLILGVSSIIKPISYAVSYNSQMVVLLFGTLLLLAFPFIGKKNEMTRSNGIIYLLIYFGYMAALFLI